MSFTKGSLLDRMNSSTGENASDVVVQMTQLQRAHSLCIKVMQEKEELPPPLYQPETDELPPEYDQVQET